MEDRVLFLAIDEIDWIEAADYNVRIHAGEEVHTLRERLSNLEERLESRAFVRIHRSALVNLSRVKGLRRWVSGTYRVLLEDGTELRMSRQGRRRLEGFLGRTF